MEYDNEERSATIATVEETCFRIVSKHTFQQALANHTNLAFEMLVGLVKRLREADLVIENKPTHQDLANMIGASREMVTRLLRDLVRGSYIRVEQNCSF